MFAKPLDVVIDLKISEDWSLISEMGDSEETGSNSTTDEVSWLSSSVAPKRLLTLSTIFIRIPCEVNTKADLAESFLT